MSTLMVNRVELVVHKCALLALVPLIGMVGCTKEDLSNSQRRRLEQKDAVAELEAIGGKAHQVRRPQGTSWSVNLSGVQLTDEVFEHLRTLEYITELNLSKTNVSDADMELINSREIGFVLLKLDLSKTSVTDAGLDKLNDLFLLMDLNLTGTKVTPAGVERFKKHRADDTRIEKMFKSPNIRLK
jgi:uncharacterized protein YjbI with pentapeptide repeats